MGYSKTFYDTGSTTVGINTDYLGVRRYPTTRIWTGTRSGERVPNWKEKIRLGQNATSPYSLDRTSAMLGQRTGLVGMTARMSLNPGAGITTHTCEGALVPFPSVISHLTASASESNSKALAVLNQKINSQITHVNLPATFLEFGDVIRQFGSPMRSILSLTERHINRLYLQRRGIQNLKINRADYLKVAADTYLEYAFGLAPLINDTRKAAEALARLAFEKDENPALKKRLIGRAKVEAGRVTSVMGVPDRSWIVVNNTSKVSTEVRTQYVAGFMAYPTADFGSHDRLMQLLGFRPESWIPAVWEAVPWSWLIDYFSNVQDLLQSLESSTVKPTWLSKTVSTVTTNEEYGKIDNYLTKQRANAFGRDVCTPFGSELYYHKSRRTTMTRTSPATLEYPTIHFKLPKGTRQLLNMAAVLVQTRKSQPMISLETHYRNLR